ncbi:hypothetical protein, partial [Lactobacillus paragasseri]|uniref:hypothetical protein n=1 Tax=Lactobacillus paragasseri TaxID=2107999 RepID=UPI003B93ADD7
MNSKNIKNVDRPLYESIDIFILFFTLKNQRVAFLSSISKLKSEPTSIEVKPACISNDLITGNS